MARLQTFGVLALTDSHGHPLVTQRQRLAILALLAAAGERGLSREKLIAYLWPESTSESARRALQQPVHWLRRQIHEDVFLGTDPLRLNPAIVSSDLWEFERALAAGALREALTAYGGLFLDGFFLDGSVAFEEWAESERTRLAGEYKGALSRMAREAARQGEHTLEIECWRQLSRADPLSERTALGLIRALAAAGDVAAATRHARDFDVLVRQELHTPPATDLAAYIERVHTGQIHAEESVQAGAERYVIEREIRRGSMATVYLARDCKLGRMVALKLLKTDLARAVMAKRFLREISVTAGLHHPHILQLHDAGEMPPTSQGPRLFYVMPYVQGESLRERMTREPQLPTDEAVRLGREIADALAYAHERGIVHRDIKPDNILLQSGHALVSDFGIARALDLAGGERLSLSGITLGTPGYMSPEQARGGAPLDGRSDLYSLGCVLYEMLAGGPPFTGPSTHAILARHAVDPVPPLRTVCPGIPPSLELAVLKAMAKIPDDRFASAVELADALGAVDVRRRR